MEREPVVYLIAGPASAGKSAAAHFLANTDPNLGESCDVCHGSFGQFSVDKMHAQ